MIAEIFHDYRRCFSTPKHMHFISARGTGPLRRGEIKFDRYDAPPIDSAAIDTVCCAAETSNICYN
jgi:hypothetical protein